MCQTVYHVVGRHRSSHLFFPAVREGERGGGGGMERKEGDR